LGLTLACILVAGAVLAVILAVRMDVLIAVVVRMRCGVVMRLHLAV
jgi:hypothetical protein